MKRILQSTLLVLLLTVFSLQLSANTPTGATYGFNLLNSSGCAPLTVGFENTSQFYDPETIFIWKIDGKLLFEGFEPSDSTFGLGEYQVTMEAYSPEGTLLWSQNEPNFIYSYGISGDFNINSGTTACLNTPVQFSVDDSYQWLNWSFGDGDSAYYNNVSHTFKTEGSFDVTLEIQPIDDCPLQSIKKTIQVGTAVTPDFKVEYNSAALCPGDELFVKTDFPASSIDWDFGDGNTATGNMVSNAYASLGEYTATVTVNNTCGGTASKDIQINIENNLPAEATFDIESAVLCPATPIQFETYSAGNVTWAFGDGYNSNDRFPIHTYNNSNYFKVSLLVINGCGNKAVYSQEIDLSYGGYTPSAQFLLEGIEDYGNTVDTIMIAPGETVQFVNNSNNHPSVPLYMWSFEGEPEKENGSTFISHTYASEGMYQPTLNTYNGCGDMASDSRVVIVTASAIPHIEFGTMPDTICPGEDVYFYSDEYFYAHDNYTYYADFDINDGQAEQEITPLDIKSGLFAIQNYSTEGKYYYYIKANNGYNDKLYYDSVVVTTNEHVDFYYVSNSTAEEKSPEELLAGFSFINPIAADSVYYVWFSDTTLNEIVQYRLGTAAGDKGERDYPASFGTVIRDETGMTFTSSPLDSPPSEIGEYNYTINENGIMFSFISDNHTQRSSTLANGPFFNPNESDKPEVYPACVGDTVLFSCYGGQAWEWHFGDGTTSNLAEPWHIYSEPGVYEAYVVVQDACASQADTVYTTVTISGGAELDSWFYADNYRVDPAQEIIFTYSGMGDRPVNYTLHWDFGDGNTNTGEQVNYSYANAGFYDVTLTVTTACVSASSTQTILVNDLTAYPPVPKASAGYYYETISGGTTTLSAFGSADVNGNEGVNITYNWQVESGSLSDNSAQEPSFTVPEVTKDSTIIVTLDVTDINTSTSSKDFSDVKIYAFKADAGDDLIVEEGSEFTLDGSNSVGNYYMISWFNDGNNTIDATVIEGSTIHGQFKAPYVDTDTQINIVLQIDHYMGGMDYDTVTVTVQNTIAGNAIYVSESGNDNTGDGTYGNPYLTIASAVSVSAAGDIIVVMPGTSYTLENVSITNELTITSEQGPETVTLNVGAESFGFVINASGLNVYLHDVKLFGESPSTLVKVDAGIIHVDNCMFTNTDAAISTSIGTEINVTRSVFTNNYYGINNGNALATITNNTFYNCEYGVYNEGDLTAKNNIFHTCSTVGVDGTSGNSTQSEYNLYYSATLDGATSAMDIEGVDPLFVNAGTDFNLTLNSPALNAGDPASPLDPDGTRADIGAYYFEYEIMAHAGPDQFVDELQMVYLDGNNSQGRSLSYLWEDLSGELSLVNSNTSNPDFYANQVYSDTDYFIKLTVTDEWGYTDIDTVVVQVIDQGNYPEYFPQLMFISDIDKYMDFYIHNALIDGVPLEPGDEIAIFDGDQIVGVAVADRYLDGSTPLLMKAYENGAEFPDPKNGYIEGKNYRFEVYDRSVGIGLISITQGLISGNNVFTTLGEAHINLNIQPNNVQTIELTEGWNIISFFVDPMFVDSQTDSVLNILQPLIDEGSLEKVQDEAGNAIEFITGTWNDAIGYTNYDRGYKVKVNTNTELTIEGELMFIPEIFLTAGWNITAYPLYYSSPANEILNDLFYNGSLMKSMDERGRSIEEIPGSSNWNFGFNTFKPDEGYRIRLSEDDYIFLSEGHQIPDLPENKSANQNQLMSEHFIPGWEGNGFDHMNMYFATDKLLEAGINIGDEIAVFDQGVCVGLTKISETSAKYTSLVLIADDPLTIEKDGFEKDNAMELRVWIQSENREITISDYSILEGTNKFNASESVVIQINHLGITSGFEDNITYTTSLGTNYPNPFKDKTRIDFVIDQPEFVKIEVYNVIGEKIAILTAKDYNPGKHYVEWDRKDLDGDAVSNGLYLYKMTAGNYSGIKRMMVIK